MNAVTDWFYMSNTRAIKVMAPAQVIAAIDEEVAKGKFTGRGDFALYAIRFYLDRLRDERIEPKD
jgi:Arc/MetJ-type ribon-helix-helix transcriptional regulator